MVAKAYAKINWTLDITGIRPDGYHLLDMLMQPVSLYDLITVTPDDDIHISCSGLPQPTDETNLASRAAKLMRSEAGILNGASIHLHKQLPSRAGMGGGSADAAAVLIALNSLWSLGWPLSRLEALGLRLGADVPFCVHGGLARVRGIGEDITPMQCDTVFELVILRPDAGLDTGNVFKAWREVCRRPDTQEAYRAIRTGDLQLLARSAVNVLQPAAEEMCPDIGAYLSALKSSGAIHTLMTGSGSAVYGVFANADAADKAYRLLLPAYDTVLRCKTQTASVEIVNTDAPATTGSDKA